MTRTELRPVLIALGAVLLYLATAPGTVNADGLGYLKLLPHNFAAGHLLYMPLLRFATTHLGGDGLKAGRLLDALLGGTGVLLVYTIARRAAPLRSDRTFVATFASMGTALSYGWWVECADVEAYALATVALLALVRVSLPYPKRPGLGRALTMGFILGACVACHLTHVLLSIFVVVVCLEDPRGRARGIASATVALVTGGTLALGLYAYAAFVVRGHHLEGAVRWVLSAQHGFSERSGLYSIAAAVYGLARTLVWSPYLYEADAPKLIGQLLLGLVLLVTVVLSMHARRSAVAGLPLGPILALALPYTLLGVLFFGADPERWIFVLPFLWIAFAVAIDAGAHRVGWAAGVLVYIGVLNLALAVWPAHEDSWTRHQAKLAAAPLSSGDLVIFPGHSWDEYVAFYGDRAVEPFPLSYYAARDGQAQMWSRLDREVAAARARGHAVYALRLFDESREVADDPAGYAELRAIGMSRGALRAALDARFRVTPILDKDGVTVVRLDPASGAVINEAGMPPSVDYVVSLADRNAHLYRVELTLEGAGNEVALHLPVWTPGSYLVREFARHLQDVECVDEAGKPLPIGKTDKATWTAKAGPAKRITVRYRVYAHDLTVRAAHLDDSHGFWNGAAMFLYHQPSAALPHRVHVVAPPEWRTTVGLPEVAPSTFEAADYDELVDSPFEVGTHELLTFQAAGKPHRLAIWGHVPMARDKLTTDIPKIVAAGAALFDGTVPYDDYTFILLSTPGGYGGLEHRRSTTLLTSPYAFSPRKKYEEFLELVAHEYFHLWNVKRIHPTALGPFDYQHEAYTRSLWVMEGITSYYDRLLLVRAGLKKPRAYLQTIADELGKIAETPGRLKQSLEEASFDAWIKFYRPDENSSNSSISYYLKGGIVALLIDLAIRVRTEGVRSLDDVMRLLWRRYGARNVGFADADVQALFEEGAGCSLDDLFSRYVRGRDELDPKSALRSFGLEVTRSRGDEPAPWLGVTTREHGDSAVVATTLAGGPGEAAGLFAGDELVAIDGFRVEAGTLRSRLRDRRIGEAIELTVFRRDQLRTLQLKLGEKPAATYEIAPAEDATAAEGAAFERWLGAPLQSIAPDED